MLESADDGRTEERTDRTKRIVFLSCNAAGDCVGSANRACNADLETIAPLALERESLRRSTTTRDIPQPFESEAALRKRHASTLRKQTRRPVLVLPRDGSRFFFVSTETEKLKPAWRIRTRPDERGTARRGSEATAKRIAYDRDFSLVRMVKVGWRGRFRGSSVAYRTFDLQESIKIREIKNSRIKNGSQSWPTGKQRSRRGREGAAASGGGRGTGRAGII